MNSPELTRAQLLLIVREELARAAPDVPADADPAASFKHDLQVDSLAVLELVARLEYRCAITVPDEDWQHMATADSVARYLAGALAVR